MLVVFRADASVQIGTGHVMRCLTLAEQLRQQGHQCQFICRDHPGHLGELIEGKGFELHLLAGTDSALANAVDIDNSYTQWLGVTWQQDARQALEVLSSLAADWLVVDHYALDARWEKGVAAAVGQIMVIDDLADRNHDCALLLDQNLGSEAAVYDHKVPDDCIRLIGPQYTLLRPEFARLRESSLERRRHPQLKRILISLGGVDRNNVTGEVLQALSETSLPSDTELDIIMGAAAPYLDEIRKQALNSRFRATVSVSVSDMAERMCQADLSIGAAGSTSWERCCLGLPAILVVLADNQRSAAQALHEQGVAIVTDSGAGVRDALNQLLAGGGLEERLVAMAHAGAELIDGMGCHRVVEALTGSIDGEH